MGVDKFIMSHWATSNTASHAIGQAVSGRGTEQAIDAAFRSIAPVDSVMRMFAYQRFEQLVAYHVAQRRAMAPAPVALVTPEPVETVVVEADKREAVPGHPGIHSRTHADASLSYMAKWPNPDKPRATLTKSGFATVEEAETFRNEQITERVAA